MRVPTSSGDVHRSRDHRGAYQSHIRSITKTLLSLRDFQGLLKLSARERRSDISPSHSSEGQLPGEVRVVLGLHTGKARVREVTRT